MKRDYGTFQVALKLLLRRGGKFLFLRTLSGKLDLPGGRIDNAEYQAPLPRALAREVREELGGISYKLGNPLFQYRRYFEPRQIYIFITVYSAAYVSGRIRLSSEHKSCQWIDPGKFVFSKKDFFNTEEYIAFQKYFKETR